MVFHTREFNWTSCLVVSLSENLSLAQVVGACAVPAIIAIKLQHVNVSINNIDVNHISNTTLKEALNMNATCLMWAEHSNNQACIYGERFLQNPHFTGLSGVGNGTWEREHEHPLHQRFTRVVIDCPAMCFGSFSLQVALRCQTKSMQPGKACQWSECGTTGTCLNDWKELDKVNA